MGTLVFFFIIVVGVIALASVIFGGWFLITVLRGIASLLGLGPPGEPPAVGPRRASGAYQIGPVPGARGARGGPSYTPLPDGQRPCPYELCRAANDPSARFCRRCGRELEPVHQVDVRRGRRVAMW